MFSPARYARATRCGIDGPAVHRQAARCRSPDCRSSCISGGPEASRACRIDHERGVGRDIDGWIMAGIRIVGAVVEHVGTSQHHVCRSRVGDVYGNYVAGPSCNIQSIELEVHCHTCIDHDAVLVGRPRELDRIGRVDAILGNGSPHAHRERSGRRAARFDTDVACAHVEAVRSGRSDCGKQSYGQKRSQEHREGLSQVSFHLHLHNGPFGIRLLHATR